MGLNLTEKEFSFLSGGGEMGALMRSKDWSKTLIGPISTWPQSLRTSISIILNSRFPMFIFWGPDLICFYNDAYRPSLGESGKHPEILGQKAEIYWAEIWHIIKPLIDQVLAGKGGTWSEDQLIPIFRNGTLEDVYWTFGYSAVNDESGLPAGVFVTCVETTEKVFNLRQLESTRNAFKSMVEEAPVGITILKGKEFLVEIANESYLKLVDRSSAEFIGKPLFTSLPEVKDFVEPILLNVLQTGNPFKGNEFEIPVKRFGKTALAYFNFIYQPLREADGSINTVMVVAIEVTELTVARHKSADAEEKLQVILNASQLGTWEWILKTDTINYSKRYLEIFGYQDENLLIDHTTLLAHIEPTYLSIREAALKKSFETGKLEYQAQLIKKDGKTAWMEVIGKMFYDDSGKPLKLIGTIRDITEQKNHSQQLEDSELRFRTIADLAPVLIWMAGMDKGCNFFNKAWLQFTGRSIDEEFGNGWAVGVHPDDVERCMNTYINAFDKREEFYMEYRLKRHDGIYRWLSDNGVPRFTASGLFDGYIGACMDIDDRIIFEDKLKESESRLRIAALSSELGTWEYHPDTKVLSWDAATKELFGSPLDTPVTLDHFWLKMYPDDRESTLKKMLGSMDPSSEETYDTEYRIMRHNPEDIRWIHAKGRAFFDKNNRPYLFSGTVLDITEKRIALIELEENEERMRFIANAMPQFVWTGGTDGTLDYFNEAVYTYSGLSAEEVKEGGWLQIVHPEDKEENIKKWEYALQTGEPFLFEHRFKRHDGVYRWQLSRAIPQKDEQGNIQMWVGTSTDIDELKKHEEQMNDFIKMANHELKTPVTTIKGYVQLLLKMHANSTDKPLASSLNTIDKQVTKLTSLISDLLDINKIETGKLPLNTEVFSMNALVKDTVNDMQASTNSHSIEVEIIEDGRVFADRDRISQVLLNLFTNAFKYSPKADKVLLTINKVDDNVIVSIRDFGIGIAKIDQDKIFERFYRVSGKDENTFPGFGIGLFIVKEIITRHNGSLWVESEKNEGATFYFSLPTHK